VLAWKVSCQGFLGGGFPGGRFHSGRFLAVAFLAVETLRGITIKSYYGASPPRPAPLHVRMGAQELEPVLEAPRASGGWVPSLVGILTATTFALGYPPRPPNLPEQHVCMCQGCEKRGTHSAIRWDCGDMWTR